MRLIGVLNNEAAAQRFSDFLYVQGIETQIESEPGGAWAIWIHAEEEIEHSKQLLASYRANPADPAFHKTASAASTLREKAEQEQAAYRRKLHDRTTVFRSLTAYGLGPLTLALILICVAVFLLSGFGQRVRPIGGLFITEYIIVGGPLERLAGLSEILHGQVWRMVTPMFIHFGFIHIIFNLLWLRDLGGMIEGRQGTGQLAWLVLVIAAGSNLAQYAMSGPQFGGMSGVVYGLLGYVWIRGKFDPGSGLFLHPSTVTMMLIWFFVCFTGLFGPIANTVHAVGLGMGVAWGYFSSLTGPSR